MFLIKIPFLLLYTLYSVFQWKMYILRYHIFSANADRFSKFFHQAIRKKILYVYIVKISTSPAICCYTNVWKSKKQKFYQILTLNVTINV